MRLFSADPTPTKKTKLRIPIVEKLAPLAHPARYKVAHGGRGSGKSTTIARLLILRSLVARELILCCREFQVSIADSVHRILSEEIVALGLSQFFDVQKTSIVCTATGSEFIFKGLARNLQSIRSMQGITICWIAEAQTASRMSFQVLFPTVRAAGSEIWMDFNPENDDDPVYADFVVDPPAGAIVCEANWQDNPWFPQVLEDERRLCLARNPDDYDWIWGGKCRRISSAAVFRGKLLITRFDTPAEGVTFYHGADWGFSSDPTVLLRMWIDGDRLMIDREAWAVGCDIDQTPRLFDTIPTARRWKILADNARPETISYMRNAGFLIEAAEKWHGSVEDGAAFLRGFERIVIHEDFCPHAAEEFRGYRHKVDQRTGRVLPDFADGSDHCPDAARYGLADMIRRGGMKSVWSRLV